MIGAAALVVAAVALAVALLPRTAPESPESAEAPSPRGPAAIPIVPAPAPVGPCTETYDLGFQLERLGGLTPAGTAACAALTEVSGGADHAVVATGTAEALLSAPLADALDAPVLLAGRDELPGETVTALTDLDVEEVTVVGAASERLLDALEETVGAVDEVRGDDLTTLSLAVTERHGRDRTVLLSAADPAELLVAATAAVRSGAGLVVLDGDPRDDLLTIVREAEEVVAIGHPARLPDAWLAPIRERIRVDRVDGRDLAGTAAGVARWRPGTGPHQFVDSASGALAHAVAVPQLAKREDAALLFVENGALPPETERLLRLEGAELERGTRLVGPPAGAALLDALTELVQVGQDGPPEAQVRGAWAHLFDDSLKTRAGITTFLDRAVETGLNTVVVQASRRQDAYYQSDVLPRTRDPALEPGLDLLAELVPRAHARGLEVHAWVAVVQSWHPVYEDLPAPDGWVWSDHGPGSDDLWVTRPHPDRAAALGYPGAYRDYPYLDLGVPAVQDHIAATMREIAARYPVDAVHLDYLRYPGRDWGYHPVALRRFAEETGANIDPPPAPTDRAWSDWRRSQATALLQRIRDEVAAARPGVAVSAAVIAQGDGPGRDGSFEGTVAYSELMQDWARWVRADLLDLTIPMAYFDERRFADRYDRWVAFSAGLVEEGANVAIGQGSWLNPTALSLSQAEQALSETRGLVLYSYQQDTWCPAGTTETGDPCRPVEPPTTLWRQLAEGPFRDPAPAR